MSEALVIRVPMLAAVSWKRSQWKQVELCDGRCGGAS